MQIDGFQIGVEHTKGSSFFTVRGRPFGVQARLATVEQLEALAAELTSEASTWRRRIAPDHYAILEIARTATADEIKAAYRAMQKQFHPDTKGGNTGKSQSVNSAYEILSDPLKRKAYDETIHHQERS